MTEHLLGLIAEQGGSWSANQKAGRAPNENEIIVSVEDFFTGSPDDGQDFAANTGICNDAFYQRFCGIQAMESVQGVWIVIYDYDEDEDEWPYGETCYIAATAAEDEISGWFGADAAPSTVERLRLEDEPLKNLPCIPKGSLVYRCWWD